MKRNRTSLIVMAFALITVLFTACKDDVKVDDVTVTPTEATLKIGETLTIVPTVTPSDADDKSVKWNSDKPEIAEVNDNGTVTAKGEGTAIITCTTNNGGHKAITTITVIPDEDDYANLIKGDYLGKMIMVSTDEIVADDALIGIKRSKTNIVEMSMNQTLDFNGMSIPIDIVCEAGVTLNDGKYVIHGTTEYMTAPVTIDGTFDDAGVAVITININMGMSIEVRFEGNRQ